MLHHHNISRNIGHPHHLSLPVWCFFSLAVLLGPQPGLCESAERAPASQPAAKDGGGQARLDVDERRYSDTNVEKFRSKYMAELVSRARASGNVRVTQEFVQQRRAVAAMPVEELRALLRQRDVLNEAEHARMAKRFRDRDAVVLEACRWLEARGIVDSATPISAEANDKEGGRLHGTGLAPVRFQFTTKSGHVRRHNGFISFSVLLGDIPVPSESNIDGVDGIEAEPREGNRWNDMDLDDFVEEYGGSYSQWSLEMEGEKLILRENNYNDNRHAGQHKPRSSVAGP